MYRARICPSDALRLFLASRELKDKQNLLVPELAECIAEASDKGYQRGYSDMLWR